jgi:hypothetical protein
MQKCIKLIIMFLGKVQQGRVAIILLALSLITCIFLSISPTCSLVALVFIVIFGKTSLNFSNSMSIKATCIINPAPPYTLVTHSRVSAKHLAVRKGKNSIVNKLIPLKEVTKNGKLFMNNTSATNVTYLCIWIKSQEIFT